MIKEDLYFKLLKYTKQVFYGYNIDPMDIAHDVICEGGVEESKFASILLRKKSELAKERSVKPILLMDFNPCKIPINYKHCLICDDIYPEHEFYTVQGSTTQRKCKSCYNKKNIGRKRSSIKPRDRGGYTKAFLMKDRSELKDSYIIDLLKKNGFSRAEITDKMIADKRRAISLKRQNKPNGKHTNYTHH